jgi:hypothetical protein
MKFSELIDIANEYETYTYSDANCNVIFGCDCGCGGDSYTPESWSKMLYSAEQSKAAIIRFCQKNNIDMDVL